MCPHCQTVVRFELPDVTMPGTGTGSFTPPEIRIQSGSRNPLKLVVAHCPSCGKDSITLEEGQFQPNNQPPDTWNGEKMLVWPRYGDRPPAPQEVPSEIAKTYAEAAMVLPFSPKASAALSRRCLQAVLREAGFHQHDLSKQIEAVLPTLPSYIATNVDAIRNVGNFAAHPTKDTNSGAIIEVEPGEAEWNLDVLDELFDFYYVQPAVAQRKRDALNEKLQAANKPPMK